MLRAYTKAYSVCVLRINSSTTCGRWKDKKVAAESEVKPRSNGAGKNDSDNHICRRVCPPGHYAAVFDLHDNNTKTN